MPNENQSRETQLKFILAAIYAFLLVGFLAPIVNYLLASSSYEKPLKLVVPAIAAILVGWFQKAAAQLLKEGASFAIPGVRELRQKHLLHVNRLEWAWLVLAVYVAIWAVL